MLIKIICDYVFLIFFKYYFNNMSGALYSISKLFDSTNKIVLSYIEKILKKIRTQYICKQLK